MNTMAEKRKSLMAKKKTIPFHIKHNYKKYKSVNGYSFWARDDNDAKLYCKQMNWVIGDLEQKKSKGIQNDPEC